jgi:indole-3-glycerol phosphate synthase
MNDVLARICIDKRELLTARRRDTPQAEVEARAKAAPPPRGFAKALRARDAAGSYGLICEIKKASPSKGLIREDFDPPALARAYADGGATCLSVLTDTPYFQGRDEHLVAARAAVEIPVLRKDFMLDPYQIFESRALGADCVLLILAALTDPQAAELEQVAGGLGMDVLVEVHNGAELDRALALQSSLLGINNRDLKTLAVDLAVTEALAPLVPPERLVVAESGLHVPADLARLGAAGAAAFLVGDSLMRQADVAAATAALLAAPPPRQARS